MKSLLSILALSISFFSVSAFAVPPSQVDFSTASFDGLRVLDKDGQDSFAYMIKQATSVNGVLIKRLQSASASEIVSPLYELNQVSASKNIYVYVGKTAEGTFELVIARELKDGSFFVVDMDIVNVEKRMFTLQHGPSDQVETYIASRLHGNLLP